jgi:site-specific DNA recombinase
MTEMHVYSYARISSDMQAESSIDDQHRVCRNYAAKLGWVIHAEFSDVGISGAALGNRP